MMKIKAMKKNKFLKILLIASPFLVGLGVVIYYTRKKTPAAASQASVAVAAGGTPSGGGSSSGSSGGCTFPLKTGSNNSCVKQLQEALGGLTVDGSFGPLTLGQLMLKTGKTQITNAADLANTIAGLSGSIPTDPAFERKSQAGVLQLQYNSGNVSNWRILSDTTWQGVDWPVNTPNGKNVSYKAGTILGMNNYAATDITDDGYLVIFDYLTGSYKVDPNAIATQ